MNTDTKKCPMCAEEIPLASVTCEYCGAQFEVTSTGYCQTCHAVRGADENGQCNICGKTVVDFRVVSRYVEEQVQSPAPILQPVAPSPKTKTPKKPISGLIIIGAILVIGAISALLWLRWGNQPVVLGMLATSTPTLAPTNTLTITPTIIPSPTSTPLPTITITALPVLEKYFWSANIKAIMDRSPDFQDDFSQNSGSWSFNTSPDDNKGKIEIGENVLVMSMEPGESGFSTNPNISFDDFILQVNINLEQLGDLDDTAEIIWRGASDGGEVFSIWNNGRWQVVFCGSDGCDLLASGQMPLLSTELVTVTIISRGTEFAVFLNSSPLCYLNDQGRRPGTDIKLGLTVNANSPTTGAVEYEKLKVWNLSGVTIPTPAVSLKPPQAVNTPAIGTGTAAGRILWNDQGMAGVTVKLCNT
jgi:hypothetical protein